MGFLNQNLLYLLFLVPLLILLYILRLKRKEYVVSSTILWEQDVEDIKANTFFQKLRKNLLLPLQLLVMILVIFALSRPFIKGSIITNSDVVLLIDASASMKATDINKSRFEALKTTAINIIDNLNNGSRVTIVESGISPKVILEPTSNKSLLKDTILRINPSDAPTNLNIAIQLASSISEDIGQSEIILMSDGNSKIGDIDADLPIRFISFGREDSDNIGIISLDVIDETKSTKQAFASVKNFGNKKHDLSISLYYNDAIVDVRSLSLMPKEQRPIVFDSISYNSGILTLSIDVKDDFSVDNKVYYALRESSKPNLLFVSNGNLFLEKAFESSPTNLKLSKQKPDNYQFSNDYDLIVYDSFVPRNLPDCNIMFINPIDNLPFAKQLSKERNPVIVGWDKANPLTRFVDLSIVKIASVNKYDTPSWMKSLADTDKSSLILYGENEGRKIILLTFPLDANSENNFPLTPAFPIFISNSLSWLTESDSLLQNKAGELINLSVSDIGDNQPISIIKPDKHEIKANLQNGRLLFNDADEVGVYNIKGDKIQTQFAVNLLDESESNIKPSTRLKVSGIEIQSMASSVESKRELWTICAFLALMFLSVEWWVYHRRVLV